MIYRKLFIIFILLFLKICVIYSEKITLNLIIFSYYDDENSYYRLLVKGFNKYTKEKGLDIDVDLTVLTPEISTIVIENYGTTVESTLLKKQAKYDIIFYYSAYSKRYSNHFLNLKEYLPEEYIKVYDERLLNETCSSSDKKKLVGLPIYLYVTTLYSHQDLLLKYNKEAPRTWDELMSTSKYIYDEEKKLNNTIVRYNGLFNDYSGSMTFYEFINSFRKSNSSPHPEITSKTTIEALKKLKEMKDEIGEEIFNASDDLTINNIFVKGEALFLRYFYNPHVSVYKGSALPGRERGVSGTIVIPNNFAIHKYIEENKKFAAIEFMKYISLKETQKEYIIKNYMFSGIMDLYNDEEVCNMIECDIIKDAYPFSFMSNDINLFGDDNYHIKYRTLLTEYLYKNRPLIEVLKKIEDITKIYTFTFKTDYTNSGLVILIILLTLSTIIILSLIFIFIKKLENRFKFLSKDLWVLTILGFLIVMSSIITLYGDVTNVNCHLKISLISMGFILSISPSLLKLITNFPEKNKISLWFEKNKYIFILTIMLFTLSLNGIFATSSYTIQGLTTSDEKNYKKCVMNSTFGNIIYYLIHVYHIIIILIVLFFIFIEWSLTETSLDVNFLATALFMDILSIILLIIIDKITFKNFIIYNILMSIDILIFSGSNYLFIYFIRILPMFEYVKNVSSKQFLKEVLNTELNDSKELSNLSSFFHNALNNYSTGYSTTGRSSSTSNSKLTEVTKKIMNYHNQKIIINPSNPSNTSQN